MATFGLAVLPSCLGAPFEPGYSGLPAKQVSVAFPDACPGRATVVASNLPPERQVEVWLKDYRPFAAKAPDRRRPGEDEFASLGTAQTTASGTITYSFELTPALHERFGGFQLLMWFVARPDDGMGPIEIRSLTFDCPTP